jgi:hypothetical protein
MRREEYHTDQPDDYGPQQDRTKEELEFDGDTRLMGQAYHNAANGDSFVKLTRYRNSARHSYYQALNALRDAQDRRRNPPQQNLRNEPNSEQPPAPPADTPALPAAPPAPPADEAPRDGTQGQMSRRPPREFNPKPRSLRRCFGRRRFRPGESAARRFGRLPGLLAVLLLAPFAVSAAGVAAHRAVPAAVTAWRGHLY